VGLLKNVWKVEEDEEEVWERRMRIAEIRLIASPQEFRKSKI
jgi:hypothetical protein